MLRVIRHFSYFFYHVSYLLLDNLNAYLTEPEFGKSIPNKPNKFRYAKLMQKRIQLPDNRIFQYQIVKSFYRSSWDDMVKKMIEKKTQVNTVSFE